MSYGIYRNCEGYSDPTAGAAMSNILRKERSQRRKAIRRKNRRLRKEAADKLTQDVAETTKEACDNDG
ncbi:MAG: hypothetical protein E7467_00095 [Ruminococcaceae bacterium]|nr:hypothetical protein [Oscillospiraceae bacterium]